MQKILPFRTTLLSDITVFNVGSRESGVNLGCHGDSDEDDTWFYLWDELAWDA